MRHAQKSFRKIELETLDERLVPAAKLSAVLMKDTLVIEGTERADTVVVRLVNDSIRIAGLRQQFAVERLKSVTIETLGGNDRVLIAANVTPEISILIDGGGGDDRIVGGPGNDLLRGGSGNDVIQ